MTAKDTTTTMTGTTAATDFDLEIKLIKGRLDKLSPVVRENVVKLLSDLRVLIGFKIEQIDTPNEQLGESFGNIARWQMNVIDKVNNF